MVKSDIILQPCLIKIRNLLIRDGKKSKADRLLVSTFSFLEKSYPGESRSIFYRAISNVQPIVGVRLKERRGRKKTSNKVSYLPYSISAARSQNIGIRSLIKASRRHSSKLYYINLAEEFILASQFKGQAIKIKLHIHELAKKNSDFSHFRWN
ncbi:unnamed protein product [Choristocarpus tenellus]|uniref:ribosomal protein S7 n=1 Tax=Choristocarpus tenellus TaxID=116065 RepID=UPI002E7A586D|nr:ribosomal protein S7 [Choristocarpus tenellus]WBP69806.1 ribosomal protein S7 [Choristocarpus tenellus]